MNLFLLLLVLLFLSLVIVILVTVYLRCSIRMCKSKVCMKGKVVIVTGANVGIGFHTAKNLAMRGARVILACRSQERCTAARHSIVTLTGNEDVVFRKLDLSSLKSVREFAANILYTEDRLHVLVNNAGIYGLDDLTEDGIVEAMQVNYFGHFLLTVLLLPLLMKSQPSRIINLSSMLHFLGQYNPEPLRGPFQSLRNYCNSKFCMLMFSVELSRRLAGTGVVANAVHPGVIMTGISSHFSIITKFVFWWWCLIYNRTAEQGAQTVEHLAVAAECADVSGKYFVDCGSSLVSWRARNEPAAKLLWNCSEKLVGYRENQIETKSILTIKM